MTKLTEEKIESRTIFTGKILDVRLDRVLLPNGREATRELVYHPGAVAVVPVTEDGKVILVRQYRYPVDEILLEIPAGKLDKGESPDSCAVRELEEETGFLAKDWRKLTGFYSAPGFTNEILHLYLARDLQQVAQKLDEDEFLHVESYTPVEVRGLLENGSIKDAKTIIGLLMAGF